MTTKDGEYFNKHKIGPLFEKLMAKTLTEKPADPQEFIVQHLITNSRKNDTATSVKHKGPTMSATAPSQRGPRTSSAKHRSGRHSSQRNPDLSLQAKSLNLNDSYSNVGSYLPGPSDLNAYSSTRKSQKFGDEDDVWNRLSKIDKSQPKRPKSTDLVSRSLNGDYLKQISHVAIPPKSSGMPVKKEALMTKHNDREKKDIEKDRRIPEKIIKVIEVIEVVCPHCKKSEFVDPDTKREPVVEELIVPQKAHLLEKEGTKNEEPVEKQIDNFWAATSQVFGGGPNKTAGKNSANPARRGSIAASFEDSKIRQKSEYASK